MIHRGSSASLRLPLEASTDKIGAVGAFMVLGVYFVTSRYCSQEEHFERTVYPKSLSADLGRFICLRDRCAVSWSE